MGGSFLVFGSLSLSAGKLSHLDFVAAICFLSRTFGS